MRYTRRILGNMNLGTQSTKPFVEIDYSDLADEFDVSVINLPIFDISDRYANIKTTKGKYQRFDDMAVPVNNFFSSISKSHQFEILKFISTSCAKIDNLFEDISYDTQSINIIGAMKDISKDLVDLDMHIDLVGQIRNYVFNNIDIGDFSNAGQSPQDEKDKTYVKEEARECVCISIISKIMLPVFGRALSYIQDYTTTRKLAPDSSGRQNSGSVLPGSYKSDKELYVSLTVDALIKTRFSEAYDKLCTFISVHVRKQYDDSSIVKLGPKSPVTKNKNFTDISFKGIDSEKLVDHVMSNLLVKAFVNGQVHINEDKKHIVHYMIKSINEHIGKALNPNTSSASASRFLTREDKSAREKDAPQFETDSIASNTTLDTMGIIESSIDRIISSLIPRLNAEDLYPSVLAWNKLNPTNPSLLTRFLLTNYFHKELVGGESLFYIRYENLVKLISIFQIQLLKINKWFFMHIVTAANVGKRKNITEQGVYIRNTYKQHQGYKIAEKHFTVASVNFNKTMESIVKEITENEFEYRTPNILWNLIESENGNGRIIEFPGNITDELGRFLVYKV